MRFTGPLLGIVFQTKSSTWREPGARANYRERGNLAPDYFDALSAGSSCRRRILRASAANSRQHISCQNLHPGPRFASAFDGSDAVDHHAVPLLRHLGGLQQLLEPVVCGVLPRGTVKPRARVTRVARAAAWLGCFVFAGRDLLDAQVERAGPAQAGNDGGVGLNGQREARRC